MTEQLRKLIEIPEPKDEIKQELENVKNILSELIKNLNPNGNNTLDKN